MSDDVWGLHAPHYEQCLPDLSEIESLDLNWDHGLDETGGSHFGLIYLYSVGNTGHRYVAACAIPTLDPKHYPIALVNEEGYTVDIFASSLTSWLPCYLLYRVGTCLTTALWRAAQKRSVQPIQWLEEEVEQFLAEEGALRTALQGFAIPGLEALLTTLLGMLRHKDTLDAAAWQPADFYTLIEPSGYVCAYRRLAAAPSATLAEWRAVIEAYPFYNKPLFHLFAEQPTSPYGGGYGVFASNSSWKVSKGAWSTIPLSLAQEVFHRRTAHDSTGVFDTDVLVAAARRIASDPNEVDGPLAPLIRSLAGHSGRTTRLGSAFFEAGQRWESQGATRAFQLRALTCYENAIHQHALKTGEWHLDALGRVRALAATLGDEAYQRYLEETLDEGE